MVITKTQKAVNTENVARTKANVGCNICPNCGESTDIFDYIGTGVMNKGIMSLGSDYRCKGFFSKAYHVDMYKCCTCGVEWESDPY